MDCVLGQALDTLSETHRLGRRRRISSNSYDTLVRGTSERLP